MKIEGGLTFCKQNEIVTYGVMDVPAFDCKLIITLRVAIGDLHFLCA